MTASEATIPRKRRIGFDKINRRTHLYSGLLFLPWFLFYGLSAAAFNHPNWFDTSQLKQTPLFSRVYAVEAPSPVGDLRPFAERVLRASGLDGQFVVRAVNEDSITIVITQDRFLSNTIITWNSASRMLKGARTGVNWHKFLTRVHARGGFETPGFLQNLWAVIVDAVQGAIIIWMFSGIYMWWHLTRFRFLGLMALGCGLVMFAAFLLGL